MLPSVALGPRLARDPYLSLSQCMRPARASAARRWSALRAALAAASGPAGASLTLPGGAPGGGVTVTRSTVNRAADFKARWLGRLGCAGVSEARSLRMGASAPGQLAKSES